MDPGLLGSLKRRGSLECAWETEVSTALAGIGVKAKRYQLSTSVNMEADADFLGPYRNGNFQGAAVVNSHSVLPEIVPTAIHAASHPSDINSSCLIQECYLRTDRANSGCHQHSAQPSLNYRRQRAILEGT